MLLSTAKLSGSMVELSTSTETPEVARRNSPISSPPSPSGQPQVDHRRVELIDKRLSGLGERLAWATTSRSGSRPSKKARVLRNAA
jgi:hypothetical protein